MAIQEAPVAQSNSAAPRSLFARLYRVFGYFGLGSVMAALVYGFRYSPEAEPENYLFDAALYVAFIAPHLVLTRSWWKKAVWGYPAGSPRERQFYIVLTIVTWLGVLWLQRPVPGPSIEMPEAIRFAGLVGFLWSLLLFFQGATPAALDGLIGMPGTEMQFSHGGETPLFTDGPYAEVRHPMYRAVILMGICALAVHANAAQLFWTTMLGVTFIGFIPIEEAQLLRARGDDYRRYCQQTPYRLFRGIW